MYVETLNQLLGPYFSSYLERIANHQTALHPVHTLLPTINPKAVNTSSLPYTYPRTSPASPIPTPLSIANVNPFKTTYSFLLQNCCIKEPHQSQNGILVFPTSPADGGLNCMSQKLVVFLPSLLLNKSFLSEKLSTSKIII